MISEANKQHIETVKTADIHWNRLMTALNTEAN